MDLHLSQAEPTALERDAIDAAFAGLAHPTVHDDRPMRTAHAGHDARARRHLLLPVLHAVQDAAGWISEGALNHIARTLSVPPAEIYGVATFYAMFSVEPRAPRVVHVCDDVACGPYGGEDIAARAHRRARPRGRRAGRVLGAQPLPGAVRARARGAPPARGRARPQPGPGAPRTTCWPRRARPAPGRPTRPTPSFADTRVSAPQTGPGGTLPGGEPLRLLRRIGVVDPASLDDYRAHGGYAALRRAIDLGPDAGDHRARGLVAHRPRRRRVPHRREVGGRRRRPRAPALPGVQRRRVRARDVQGPRAHGGRPVRAHRVDDDRRLRHRRAHRLPLHPRRVPAGHPPARQPRSTPPAPAATSART